MKITVSVPGRFPPAYHWARYLAGRGALERIITPMTRGRIREYGLPRERVRALSPIGCWNYAFQRYGPHALGAQNQIAVSAAFDAAASRMLGDCDVFNGWGSTSLRSIRAAQRRGVPAILTVASAHIARQTRELAEEHRRFGADAALTHPGVIERSIAEYAEADAIVAPCRWVAQTFIDEGVPAPKLHLVPWGVAPLRSTVLPVTRAGRERDPRVLFAGRFELRKGVPYLFEAFRQLRTHAELRIAGQPNDALLRRLGGLPERASCAGLLTGDAFAQEFRDADVFVLPSVEDGSALVTTWALAAGLPVVVSDQCGADLVEDGVNGFIVPARDTEALREKLDLLLSDEALRLRMGAAAATSATSRTWTDYGDDFYTNVVTPVIASHNTNSEATYARAA